jgi:hypothetical protein
MKSKFKFFRGYIGTLDIMDGVTYATASLNQPRSASNNEMERWYGEHQHINYQYETNEQLRLFQATTVTTVNPTLWTKMKIFGTGIKLVLKATWKSEPIAVVYVSILATFVTIVSIAKILSIW